MIFLGEKQNDRESENIHGHQELGKGLCWTGEAHGTFQGETDLYDTMVQDTRHLLNLLNFTTQLQCVQIFKESFRKWGETQNGMQNVSKQFNYIINTWNNWNLDNYVTVKESESVSRSEVSNSLQPHMDCSLPGFSVHGILQARILEWVAPPFSRGSSWTRDQTWVSHLSGRFFTIWTTKPIPNVTCYVIPLTWHPWNYKTVDLENGLVAFMNSGGLGVKGGGCAYEGATPGILCKCSASWPSLANVDLLMCC